jgi:hypothetical protein
VLEMAAEMAETVETVALLQGFVPAPLTFLTANDARHSTPPAANII